MAYETGTASSVEDFMDALQTFADAQGWTVDIFSTTNDWMAMSNGSVYVQFRWDANGLIGIFQSLGFVNTSTAPGNHTNDSGLGIVDSTAPYNATLSTTATNSRVSFFPNGPIVAYHFFTPGTTQYIHCVLETSPGVFYHMSMGTINKRGDWTGGEYVTGDQGRDTAMPVSISGGAWQSWSANTTSSNTQCSMHIEGLPGQNANGKWLISLGTNNVAGDNSAGNDRGGNPRMAGWFGAYGNALNVLLGRFAYSSLNGLVPLIPIEVWYKYSVTTSIHQCRLLGYAPDVYLFNMKHYDPGQEFMIGGETYVVFPGRQKGVSHGNLGFAYKKVV